jgi:hypothetical protein
VIIREGLRVLGVLLKARPTLFIYLFSDRYHSMNLSFSKVFQGKMPS